MVLNLANKSSLILKYILIKFFFCILSCEIPECDVGDNREIVYEQPWLRNAIPIAENSNGKLNNCVRYAPRIKNSSIESSTEKCDIDIFNTSEQIECSDFVYATDEKNVQTEVNLQSS